MTPTKFGSKSSGNKNKRHFFRWKETPGEGIGKCMYCDCRMQFKAVGDRGGLDRVWSKNGGAFTDKEPECRARPHVEAVSAKSPSKKKKATAKKKPAKRAAPKKTARRAPTKKTPAAVAASHVTTKEPTEASVPASE